MNNFTSFVTSICAACVFIGALYLICPDGAMQKPLRYILSLVFLVTAVSAVNITAGGLNADIDFKTPEIMENGELYVTSAKYVYAAALTAEGINFKKITVCTDKSENGSIVISKVIIYSDSEEARIRSALGAAAESIEVEIINE